MDLQILAGRRVMVTGAGGFLGMHLLARLHALGAHTISFDMRAVPAGLGASFIGSIAHLADLDQCVDQFDPHFVVHLAASTLRGTSREDFDKTLQVNVQGTNYLLMALQKATRLEKAVFLGSGDEYGLQQSPFRETCEGKPANAYGLSKLQATQACLLYHRTFGMPTCVLRPALAYGPGQRGEMFIPSLIRALVARHSFDMTKGEQTRDFVYVDDLVDAMLFALLEPRSAGEVINIGGGVPISLADVALSIERMIGVQGLLRLGAKSYRMGESMNYWLDSTKASTLLGWSPWVGLQEGLRRTISWNQLQVEC